MKFAHSLLKRRSGLLSHKRLDTSRNKAPKEKSFSRSENRNLKEMPKERSQRKVIKERSLLQVRIGWSLVKIIINYWLKVFLQLLTKERNNNQLARYFQNINRMLFKIRKSLRTQKDLRSDWHQTMRAIRKTSLVERDSLILFHLTERRNRLKHWKSRLIEL